MKAEEIRRDDHYFAAGLILITLAVTTFTTALGALLIFTGTATTGATSTTTYYGIYQTGVADVPLPQTDPDDLRWRGARLAEFTALCEELGQPRLAERPHLWRD